MLTDQSFINYNPYEILQFNNIKKIYLKAINNLINLYENNIEFRNCLLNIIDTKQNNIFNLIVEYKQNNYNELDIIKTTKILVDVNDIYNELLYYNKEIFDYDDYAKNSLEIPNDIICDEIDFIINNNIRYTGPYNILKMINNNLEKFIPLRVYVEEEFINQQEYNKCIEILSELSENFDLEESNISLIGLYAMCKDSPSFELLRDKINCLILLMNRKLNKYKNINMHKYNYMNFNNYKYTCPATNIPAYVDDEGYINLEEIIEIRESLFDEDQIICEDIKKLVLRD